MIIIIGRGHGGTRLISQTLAASGVFMGPTNDSGDMVPAIKMYMAASIAGSKVKQIDRYQWDFYPLVDSMPTQEYRSFVLSYIEPILQSESYQRGWKLPETILSFPWIVRMFPDARFIHWTRDPRDAILDYHLTDNLKKFNVPTMASSIMEKRIESWIYQRQIVDAMPPPSKMIHVRFEDFVLHQDRELFRLSNFLGIHLNKVKVLPEKVGEYKREKLVYAVSREILDKYGYT
jgi:hypothetical protein